MKTTGRFSQVFDRLRAAKRAAFIPYIAAGDPTLEATGKNLAALEAAGADIVELGVPFSDPIADGPVNQRAAERALAHGATLKKILAFVERYRRRGGKVPLVLFTYFNPVLRFGLSRFARAARASGVDGVLVVDLPPDEAAEYRRAMADHGIETVFLASPTTTPARLRQIDEASTGFVYYVSRLGVTGTQSKLSTTLSGELDRVRAVVRKPLAVGFGISVSAQAAAVARHADAVVVGSALVKFAEGNAPAQAARKMKRLASGMVRAIRAVRKP